MVFEKLKETETMFYRLEGRREDLNERHQEERGIGIKAEPRMDGCRHLSANKRNRLMPETPIHSRKMGAAHCQYL